MKGIIEELWRGNVISGEDSRTDSKEMKESLGYMARHHEDLEKIFSEKQMDIFKKTAPKQISQGHAVSASDQQQR